MPERFSYTTSLWQRSQSSYASTIPSEILAIKGAPTGDDGESYTAIAEETDVPQATVYRVVQSREWYEERTLDT